MVCQPEVGEVVATVATVVAPALHSVGPSVAKRSSNAVAMSAVMESEISGGSPGAVMTMKDPGYVSAIPAATAGASAGVAYA